MQNVQTAHNEMVLRALVVCCSIPPPPLMKIICLITALSVNNLNYTCTHKGRHLVLGVFSFDSGLSACLNEGGTLPPGSTSFVFY